MSDNYPELRQSPTRRGLRAATLSAAGSSGAGRSNPAPGILLCIAVSAAASALQGLEVPVFGRVWIEALVLAILLGAVVRTMWSPGAR